MKTIFTFMRESSRMFKALLVVLLLIVCSLLANWYRTPQPIPQNQFITAAPLKKAASVPKETIATTGIKVYRKKELHKKIQLPEEIVNDERKQVTATADLGPSKGGYEVLSVYDSKSQDTVIHTKKKPQPLLGFENEKRVGVGYGITAKGENEIKLYGQYTFVRVGNIYGAVQGEVNNKAEAKGFVMLEYRP